MPNPLGTDDISNPLTRNTLGDCLAAIIRVARPSALLHQQANDLPLLLRRRGGPAAPAPGVLNGQVERC